MVSMKDISETCGVSIATVSKALNGRTDISTSTKERVLEVAKKMGYVPNSSARALKTNRTYNIGVLFADEARSGLTHSYFSPVLDSFRQGVEEKGYDITFLGRHVGKSELSYSEHSKYRGVDGVIVACVDFEAEEVKELLQSGIPVVTIDYIFNDKACVMSDNIRGMEQLVSYIIQCGHKKIAYIHGADSFVTRSRIGSFLRTMKKYGIETEDRYIREGIYHAPDVSAKITHELLSLEDRPTCIVYPDDFSCIGGTNVIRSKGLSIPNDISVAGYDGQRIARVIEPKITTYRQNTEQIGRVAATKLVELIEQPELALVERLDVQGELIRGCSVLSMK
jgi:hypothetical protein